MNSRALFVAGFWLLGLGSVAGSAELLDATTGTQPVEWTIRYRGQPVMVYAFAPGKYKPYVKALYTLKGNNILRDAPFDHLHHHGLMYAIKVNGINFWEEIAGSGVQKVVQTSPPVFGRSPEGLPQATISQVLHWVAPEDGFLPDTNARPLLVEHRTLDLRLDEAAAEVALGWKSHFEVGTKTNVVVLSGANYHGLGLRFLQELDGPAEHRTAEGLPDLSGTRQDVSVHSWEAVGFPVAGHSSTVILIGHPTNPRGEAHFFAMHQPFAYLSATQGLDQEPLVYHAGDHFEVNYLVALYPETQSAEALTQRARRWQNTRP